MLVKNCNFFFQNTQNPDIYNNKFIMVYNTQLNRFQPIFIHILGLNLQFIYVLIYPLYNFVLIPKPPVSVHYYSHVHFDMNVTAIIKLQNPQQTLPSELTYSSRD